MKVKIKMALLAVPNSREKCGFKLDLCNPEYLYNRYDDHIVLQEMDVEVDAKEYDENALALLAIDTLKERQKQADINAYSIKISLQNKIDALLQITHQKEGVVNEQ